MGQIGSGSWMAPNLWRYPSFFLDAQFAKRQQHWNLNGSDAHKKGAIKLEALKLLALEGSQTYLANYDPIWPSKHTTRTNSVLFFGPALG